MAKINLTCEQCGGKLSPLEGTPDTYLCSHCGNQQVITPEQTTINQNYQVTQNITKNIYGSTEKLEYSELIAKAETYYKLKDYQMALTIFEQATKENPADYQGWWGKARCKINLSTADITSYQSSNVDVTYKKDFQNACTLADDKVKTKIQKIYHELLENDAVGFDLDRMKVVNLNKFPLKLARILFFATIAVISLLCLVIVCFSKLAALVYPIILLVLHCLLFVVATGTAFWQYRRQKKNAQLYNVFLRDNAPLRVREMYQKFAADQEIMLTTFVKQLIELIEENYLPDYEVRHGTIQLIAKAAKN